MIRNISPPLIILLDMLFVFLFVLILSNDSVIDIEIPEDNLFENAILVYSNGRNYVSVSGYKDINYTSPLIACGFQKECKNAISKYKPKNIYVALPKKTVDEIAELTLTSLEPEYCKVLKININRNGGIDINKLLSKNKCLLNISGFDKKYINNYGRN